MKENQKYPINNIILRFRDQEIEDSFNSYAFQYDRLTFRTIMVGLIIINSAMILVDWMRIDELKSPLIFRGSLTVLFIVAIIMTHYLNESRKILLQALIICTIVPLTAVYFIMATKLDLPDYFLPNAIISIIFFTVAISGLRFRYALLFVIITYSFYILFSVVLFPNEYWVSQLINLTVNTSIGIMAGYLYENSRRKIFIKNSIVNQQNQELESLNNLKNKLFSILSHDLRGPINKLITMIDLSRSDKISKEEYQQYTENISKELKYTSSYLNNILIWAKSLISGSGIKRKTTDLNMIINQVIRAFEPDIQQKKIHIENHIEPGTTILAEEDSLLMSLRNLMSNAIKYTPEYGKIEIENSDKEDYFEICIKDNGIGISPELQQDLFSLKMESKPGTKGETGSGIGLYLLREFLEKSGGSITYERNGNGGSKFYIRLSRNYKIRDN